VWLPGNGLKERIVRSQIWRSVFRTEFPRTARGQSEAVFHNFWLHIHPVKVPREVLKWTHTFWLGYISFLLFVILTVTGLLLMFYYVPSVERAYDSMKDLEFTVSLGIFLRNLHRWAAHAMVICVFLHLCQVFYTGTYKSPRQFNWVIGVMLLTLTLGLSFTGYLLPWDQLAFWAITVGTNIASYAPLVGHKLRYLLLGGNLVDQNALLRFYVLHCVVLPLLLAGFVSVHFWRVRKDGIPSAEPETSEEGQLNLPDTRSPLALLGVVQGKSPVVDVEPENMVSTWPRLLLREITVAVLVLAVLTGISLIFRAPLEAHANPAQTPNPAKAPWYFLGLQELVHYSAFVGGVLIPGLVTLFLLALPYLDAHPEKRLARRKAVTVIFTLLVLTNLTLIIIGSYFRGPGWSFVLPWER